MGNVPAARANPRRRGGLKRSTRWASCSAFPTRVGRRSKSSPAEVTPSGTGFPRPLLKSSQSLGDAGYYDFSFSGLKTAVATRVAELESAGDLEEERAHLAASFQAAAVDVLVAKTLRAVAETQTDRVLIGGGVAANRALREEARAEARLRGEALPRHPSAFGGQRSNGRPCRQLSAPTRGDIRTRPVR